ncbi:MAG: MBL fold metallo-hydrolase [Desulfuromonadaceae bacterium]
MKMKIHRGTNEIGGTCIQLSTKKTTILLDLGLSLKKNSIPLEFDTSQLDAVLISHPHQDHYGLIYTLSPNTPVYIGELGRRLIDAPRLLLGVPPFDNNFRHFSNRQPFQVGDITITALLVDHSAVDAYAFLIEAEGKRVFYSGDFRAQGRKSILFERMIANPPKDIDVLFMEGTMMERKNDKFPSEVSVEQMIYEVISGQECISFLIASSQNIDRIVSACRACIRASKTLVIDIYTAWILEQLKLISKNVPAMEWSQIRVYATYCHDKRLKAHPEYFGDFRKRVYQYRVLSDEIRANPAQYLFYGKTSYFKTINTFKRAGSVNLIYSQWLGYLNDQDQYGASQIGAYRNDPEVKFVHAHTSGHATVRDLQTFAAALKPKMLVPIHTEAAESCFTQFANVSCLEDSKEYSI